MSNIYITEPNTEGKVLLHTSFGDLDVELWPQQAPKACRNFVQLCLEGYYDDTIFHRIIAGFMVQGGDPTGTGSGGESVFPTDAFADEFHSRLRFTHRGLLAMANENTPNSNHSQFFFTLDACEFLNQKHTIFGKITGNTIFNLLSVSDVDTDAQDRPVNPPRLVSVEVLWNPFDDVVPRDVHHKRTVDAAPDAAAKKKRERKATKDLKLLSFGDEEAAFQDELMTSTKKTKKLLSSHDLLDDKKLTARVDGKLLETIAAATNDAPVTSTNVSTSAKKEAARVSLKAAVAAAASGSKRPVAFDKDNVLTTTADKQGKRARVDEPDEYKRLRDELRASRKAAPVLLGAQATAKAKAVDDMLTPLQQQRQQYLQKKKASSRSGRQEATLQRLQQFRATLESANKPTAQSHATDDNVSGGKVKTEAYHGQVLADVSDSSDSDGDGDGGQDRSWMTAKLKFKKHIDDQFRLTGGVDPSTDDNYLTIDTRQEKKLGSHSQSQQTRRPGRSERRSRSRGRERKELSSSSSRRR